MTMTKRERNNIRKTIRYKLARQALALKERVSGEQRQEHYEALGRIFENCGLDPIVPSDWLKMAEYYAMLGELGFPRVRPAHRPKKLDDLEFAEAMKAARINLLKRGGSYSHSAVAKEMAKDPRCKGASAETLRKQLRVRALRASSYRAKKSKRLPMTTDYSERARDRAEAKFKKKQERLADGAKAIAEYQASRDAAREKTVRLRALRLARDAAQGAPAKRGRSA
jgi:hypothetical protein